MSIIKSKGFKYGKNMLIGVGAAVVLMGALFKILSWNYANEMLMAGMFTEAFIFLVLGILPPEKDYYWEKLYPGLDVYKAEVQPLTAGPVAASSNTPGLNGEVVEQQLGGMLSELQSMSKSLSSLKALQEVDFSGTKDQLQAMSNFYSKMNEEPGTPRAPPPADTQHPHKTDAPDVAGEPQGHRAASTTCSTG